MSKNYQKRVCDEFNDLNRKITKLAEFINSGAGNLEAAEVILLHRQLSAMVLYSSILLERIDKFES